jgi:hypothetical protein
MWLLFHWCGNCLVSTNCILTPDVSDGTTPAGIVESASTTGTNNSAKGMIMTQGIAFVLVLASSLWAFLV